MRRPLSPQLQSGQALLPPQGVLRPHLVGRLCRRDVYLRVLGGTLSCQRTHTNIHTRGNQSYSELFFQTIAQNLKHVIREPGLY